MARRGITFQFDPDGVAEILNGAEIQGLIQGHAEGIAATVEASHKPSDGVVIDHFQAISGRKITDARDLVSVTVKDKFALSWQVRDGMLTKAAMAEGLEVKDEVDGSIAKRTRVRKAESSAGKAALRAQKSRERADRAGRRGSAAQRAEAKRKAELRASKAEARARAAQGRLDKARASKRRPPRQP